MSTEWNPTAAAERKAADEAEKARNHEMLKRDFYKVASGQYLPGCEDVPDADGKFAAEGDTFNGAASSLIKQYVTEHSFLTKILPESLPNENDYGYSPGITERHVIINIMDHSKGATLINLQGAAAMATIGMPRFAIFFYSVVSREYVVNVEKLQSYRYNPVALVTADTLKDVENLPDKLFLNGVDSILGAPDSTSPNTGRIQHHLINSGLPQVGALNPTSLSTAFQIMARYAYPLATVLMNQTTFSRVETWPRAIAGDLTEKFVKHGSAALETATLVGRRILATIKNNLVDDNKAYLFAEPDRLGVNYVLGSPRLYSTRFLDTIKFQIRSGQQTQCIANENGVAAATFYYNGAPENPYQIGDV
jgi:hypothetical protein